MATEETSHDAQFFSYPNFGNDEFNSWTYPLCVGSEVSSQVSFTDTLESSLHLLSYGGYSGLLPDLGLVYPPSSILSNSDYCYQRFSGLPEADIPVAMEPSSSIAFSGSPANIPTINYLGSSRPLTAKSAPTMRMCQNEPRKEPYGTLIYRALMSAPGHQMVLKEIYEWFETNTDRTTSAGWQNSVRHNLSMNGVSAIQ